MKNWIVYLLLWSWAFGQAQSTIEVNQNNTTHLVFPSDIIYVDLGDANHFVADYTNNILRIKGMRIENEHHFPATNLTVISKDKFYYSFSVQYVARPKLNYFITKDDSVQNIGTVQNESVVFSKPQTAIEEQILNQPSRSSAIPKSTKPTPSQRKAAKQAAFQKQKKQEVQNKIEQTAHRIIQEKALYHHLTAKHGDIKLKVTGIYHSLDHCYIKYEIQNGGAIPYDIAYTEFGIKEKKRPKRTALNEERLSPIFILNEDAKRILPMRKNRFVAVFPKLALSKDRILYLEVIENGRNLKVGIPFGRVKVEQVR